MISCLTITRPGRLRVLRNALSCFEVQTHSERELVIVHDGGGDHDEAVHELVEGVVASVRIVGAEPGRSLGWLRNLSVEAAVGEVVCQWDDDDLYHPLRLEEQYRVLTERDAAASFLVDQLHLFEPSGQLYWDDWSSELFPMSLIQGSLMARRASLPPYPDLPRGEDTTVLKDMARAGLRLAALQDQGWLYVYVYDGDNAWDETHHRAISAAKARSGPLLAAYLDELRDRLAEYPVRLRTVSLVDGAERTEVQLGGG